MKEHSLLCFSSFQVFTPENSFSWNYRLFLIVVNQNNIATATPSWIWPSRPGCHWLTVMTIFVSEFLINLLLIRQWTMKDKRKSLKYSARFVSWDLSELLTIALGANFAHDSSKSDNSQWKWQRWFVTCISKMSCGSRQLIFYDLIRAGSWKLISEIFNVKRIFVTLKGLRFLWLVIVTMWLCDL